MCSHKEITWRVVRNTVAQRMIDSSLIHKFMPSQKIRKRAKLMNAELKKRTIRTYDEYVTLKESVKKKVLVDYDTENTDYFSDEDYIIIYNSESKLKQYRTKHSTNIYTSDEDEEISQSMKIKKNSRTKSVKKRTRKSVDIKQEDSDSQSSKDDDDNKKSRAMRTTKKNNEAKPVKKNTKKSVNIERQQNSISQASLFTSDENDDEKESQMTCETKKNSKTKSVKKKTRKFVDIKQEDSDSQVCFSGSNDDDDNKKGRAMRTIKKNNEAKPVKKNTKKSVNIERQQNSISQALFTSDENDDEKESQMTCETKKNSKTKSVKKKTKKFVNIGWQEVVKKKRNMTLVSNNSQRTDILNINKQNISPSDKYDSPIAGSKEKSLSPRLEPEDEIVSCAIKSVSKDIPQNRSNVIAETPESGLQDNVLRDTTPNRKDSEIIANETNSESNGRMVSTVVCKMNSEEKVMINREDNATQRESDVITDNSNYSLNLQISSNDDESHKSKLGTSKIQSSPINNPSSSISKKQPSLSKDRNCEKPIKMEEKSSINVKDHDNAFVSPNSRLINAKRNLASMLNIVDCTHQGSSPDQEKDSGIEEDSLDKLVKRVNTGNQNNVENIVKEISVPSEPAETNKIAEKVQEDYTKDISLKVDDEILKEEDTDDDIEARESETNSPELNQIGKEENVKINSEAKTLKDSCNIQKKQLQPKVMSTEIVNKKYKIVCKKDNDVDITCEDAECNPSKLYTLTSCPSVISDDVDDTSIKTTNEIPIVQEVKHDEDEEDDAIMPSQMKRLQQLNLVMSSDSSDSDNNNGSIVNRRRSNSSMEDSRNDIPEEINTTALRSDDTLEDDYAKLENDEESNVSEKNDAEISHSEDTREDAPNSIDASHDENNVSEDKSSEDDTSGEGHNESALTNDRNVDNEDQRQKNVHYRPCNLKELIEDEELLVETLPTNLTLADISKDEEAFFLNIPDKILQFNLQDQPLIVEEKTIRFGKMKFRIPRNKVSTISCVFATGKKKPYKIVNLTEISTITIGERLSHPAKGSAKLNSHDINIVSKKKSKRKRHTSK